MKYKLNTNFILLGLLLSSTTLASVDGLPIGTNLNYTGAGNGNTIYSRDGNPAYLANYKKNDGNYGAGIDLSIYVEDNNLISFMDDFGDAMSPVEDKDGEDIADAVNVADKMITDINAAYANNTNAKLNIKGSVSLPIVMESATLYGGWSLKFANHHVGKISAVQPSLGTLDRAGLEARVTSNTTNGQVTDPDDILEFLTTNAAITLMYGRVNETSISYGRRVDNLLKIKLPKKQQIKAGTRVKLIKSSYNRHVIEIDKYMEATIQDKDIDKELQDDLDELKQDRNDTAFAIDIGGQWLTNKFQIGTIVRNINSPAIKIYNTANSATGFDSQADDEISLTPQIGVDGAYFVNKSKSVVLAGSLDLNTTENLSNDEMKWLRLGASYSVPQNAAWYYSFIPDVRLSYNKNMAGNEMSFQGLGFTFGPLNLDFAYGKQGDKQAGFASLGLEFFF
jgi:hypothetical protein